MKRYATEIVRMPMMAAFDLRGEASALSAACLAAGLGAIEVPNRMAIAGDGVEVLRLGPRRAMVLATLDAEEALGDRLSRAFSAVRAADFACVSDMTVVFSVDGSSALDVLKQGAPLDLSPEAFPPGSATGTEMWSIGVILMRRLSETDRYLIIVERSFATYLEDWLIVAGGGTSTFRPGTVISPPPPFKPS